MGLSPAGPSSVADPVSPHSAEAERSVLGSILIDFEALPKVERTLRINDFYLLSHQQIYAAMVHLAARATPIDLTTVSDELERNGVLWNVGGPAYLAGLMADVPNCTHVKAYAQIVIHRALARALIEAGGRIAAIGHEEIDDPTQAIQRVEEIVEAIKQRRLTSRANVRAHFMRHRE